MVLLLLIQPRKTAAMLNGAAGLVLLRRLMAQLRQEEEEREIRIRLVFQQPRLVRGLRWLQRLRMCQLRSK
jgi:hypothetical protein